MVGCTLGYCCLELWNVKQVSAFCRTVTVNQNWETRPGSKTLIKELNVSIWSVFRAKLMEVDNGNYGVIIVLKLTLITVNLTPVVELTVFWCFQKSWQSWLEMKLLPIALILAWKSGLCSCLIGKEAVDQYTTLMPLRSHQIHLRCCNTGSDSYDIPSVL